MTIREVSERYNIPMEILKESGICPDLGPVRHSENSHGRLAV